MIWIFTQAFEFAQRLRVSILIVCITIDSTAVKQRFSNNRLLYVGLNGGKPVDAKLNEQLLLAWHKKSEVQVQGPSPNRNAKEKE